MVYQFAAGLAASQLKGKGKMGKRSAAEQKGKRQAQMTSDFGKGGGSYIDMLRQFSEQWLAEGGNPGDIDQHMKNHAPSILAGLLETDAAKDVMDVNRMTDLAYQPAAGVMERGTQGAIESTRGAMALSGMGQGTAMPALEGSMRATAAGNRGNLYQQMLMQNLTSRYNLQQGVAMAGMGMMAPPLQQQGGGGMDWSQLAAAAGGAAGAFAGAGGGGGGGGQAPQQGGGGNWNGKPYW